MGSGRTQPFDYYECLALSSGGALRRVVLENVDHRKAHSGINRTWNNSQMLSQRHKHLHSFFKFSKDYVIWFKMDSDLSSLGPKRRRKAEGDLSIVSTLGPVQ